MKNLKFALLVVVGLIIVNLYLSTLKDLFIGWVLDGLEYSVDRYVPNPHKFYIDDDEIKFVYFPRMFGGGDYFFTDCSYYVAYALDFDLNAKGTDPLQIRKQGYGNCDQYAILLNSIHNEQGIKSRVAKGQVYWYGLCLTGLLKGHHSFMNHTFVVVDDPQIANIAIAEDALLSDYFPQRYVRLRNY